MSHSGAPRQPNAVRYRRDWLKNRMVLWGVPLGLALTGFLVPTWRQILWPTAFLWAGMLCVGNALSCGRVHCTFTGPLYLLTGLIAVAKGLGWLSLSWSWLWIAATAGTVLAFIPEWAGKVYWSNTRV